MIFFFLSIVSLLVSYKKNSFHFYSANLFSVSVRLSFRFRFSLAFTLFLLSVLTFFQLAFFSLFYENYFCLSYSSFPSLRFPFALRFRFPLRSRFLSENTFSICYAVVNLLFFVPRIFTYGDSRFLFTLLRLGQVRFSSVRFLSRPALTSTLCCFRSTSGGLKWTRTIDLTLIRRVL